MGDMQVRPVGAAPAVEPAVRPGAVPAIKASLDNVANLLELLSSPQIVELLGQIEQPRLAQDPSLVEGLLRTAVAATAAHDVPRALQAVRDLVTLNPERGAALIDNEAGLAPIHHEVREVLQQLIAGARSHAEQVLGAAALANHQGTNPYTADVLAVADRFFAAGDYINFVRAAELGQAVLAYYGAPVTAAVPRGEDTPPQLLFPRFTELWRRAPLLVLLLAWLLVGIAGIPLGAFGARPWAIGLLVLVVIQFLFTIRNARL